MGAASYGGPTPGPPRGLGLASHKMHYVKFRAGCPPRRFGICSVYMDGQPRPDSLPAAARGRGAGLNPANRFEPLRLEVLDETREASARAHPDGVQVLTEARSDQTRSIINRVDSPDLPFHWTLNPYRGCEHGCAYCLHGESPHSGLCRGISPRKSPRLFQ